MATQLRTRTRATITRACLGFVWITLPLVAGPVLADATERWPSSSRIGAEGLAWLGWLVGLTCIGILRPWSLTALRVLAPTALSAVVVLGTNSWSLTPTLACVVLAGATALTWSPGLTRAAVDADSYGTEERFPLLTPPALWFGPIEIAIALVGGVPIAAVLLLADQQWAAGVAVVVLGSPAAAFAFRSLYGVAKRFVVFVPAGLTIVDSFSLGAPVHIPRREVAAIELLAGAAPSDAADLRIGATRHSLVMQLADPTDALPLRAGRRGSQSVVTTALLFAPMSRALFLERVRARRVAQIASAPPTSSSPR